MFFRLIFPTILFDIIGLTFYYLQKIKNKPNSNPITVDLKNFSRNSPSIAFIYNECIEQKDTTLLPITNSLLDILNEELDIHPDIHNFSTFQEFYSWTLNSTKEQNLTNLVMALGFTPTNAETLNITVFYNESSSNPSFYYLIPTEKAIWRASNLGNNYSYSYIQISDDTSGTVFSAFFVYFLVLGMVLTTMVFILHAIDDVKHEKRDFLLTANLKLISYWISSLIVDFLFLFTLALISWIILIVIRPKSILYSIYLIFFNSISIILFSYIISFPFTNIEMGSSLGSNLQIILLAIFMVVDIVRRGKNDILFSYISALFPQTNLYLGLTQAVTYQNLSMKSNNIPYISFYAS